MTAYIAHYLSPAASDARAAGFFEFESSSRAGSKDNLHDARLTMLPQYYQILGIMSLLLSIALMVL